MGGYLLIAGGNVTSVEIFEAFIQLSGGKAANIAVVPTASEDADVEAEEFRSDFLAMGMPAENIHVIKICEYDRQGWVKNGDDEMTASTLDRVNAVWFTGGDQLRLTKALQRVDGSNTLVLEKLHALLDRGGTIGGSSAGAAIMSKVMIARGTSDGAFMHPVLVADTKAITETMEQNHERLLLSKGLGFFPYGIIDQHFEARDRMGRLMKSIAASDFSRGFGVYEDTAMVVNLSEGLIKVIGTGKVVVVEQRTECNPNMDFLQMTSLMDIRMLDAGETFWLNRSRLDFQIQDKFGIGEHFELRDVGKIKDSFTPSLG